MRLWVLLGAVGVLAGCGRCGAPPESEPAAVSTDEKQTVTADVPVPGAIYKAAYEKARQEITVDEAEERLSDLERDIDRDGETGP